MAKKPPPGTKGTRVILWTLIVILIFVGITVGELMILQRLGFDILGDLHVAYSQGDTLKVTFQAVGVVAFILAQPFVLLFLFIKLSDQIAGLVVNTLTNILELFH